MTSAKAFASPSIAALTRLLPSISGKSFFIVLSIRREIFSTISSTGLVSPVALSVNLTLTSSKAERGARLFFNQFVTFDTACRSVAFLIKGLVASITEPPIKLVVTPARGLRIPSAAP